MCTSLSVEHTFSVTLGMYLVVELLVPTYGNSVFNFLKIARLPKWLHHFTCPPAMYKVSISPHPHQHLLVNFSNAAILVAVKWYLTVAFVCSGFSSLIRYMICKYFLPPCGLSFHFFDSELCSRKVFHFDEIQLIYLLWLPVLPVSSKKLLPNPKLSKFTPMFSFKSFIILALICRSLIHLELVFVYSVRYRIPASFFWMWTYSWSSTIY